MKIHFALNPITKKRLQRFCAIKRAYYSFWILIISYVLSLFANLFCNNNPLIVYFNNQYYFPIFSNYTKKDFNPNEDNSLIDYKTFKTSPAFLENKNNYMVFPLIPFGPEENIPISYLKLPREITLNIQPELKEGTLDINEDFTIKKVESPEYFFETDQIYKKSPFSDFAEISSELKNALDLRFSNKKAPIFKQEIIFNKKKVRVELIAFEPDETKPNRIRIKLLNLEKPTTAIDYTEKTLYNENATPVKNVPKIFNALSEEQKNELHQKLLKRSTNYVDPISLTVNNENWKFSFERKESFYPYHPILWSNPCGFDEAGRDVLTQIIYGYRMALSFGLLLVAFTLLIGIAIGAIQGYFGGRIDLFGQRLIEIWSSLPFLYIIILLGNIHGPSFTLLLIVFGIFNWIGISYYVRADFLKLRKTSYVEAAKCLGISDFKIMWRHILPNALVPIITFFPFMLVGAIGSLTMLDYLGFGLPPGTPSWGTLLSQGHTHHSAWWLILFPSLALFFVMLLGTLIGDGLRAAFDPRKFHKIE